MTEGQAYASSLGRRIYRIPRLYKKMFNGISGPLPHLSRPSENFREYHKNSFAAILGRIINAQIDEAYISNVENDTIHLSIERFIAWCAALRSDPRNVLELAEKICENGMDEK